MISVSHFKIMRQGKILVVGSLVEDCISRAKTRVPNSGETIEGAGFTNAPGGKGANQAVEAARLGAPVDFFGQTGDDTFARDLHDAIRDNGINAVRIKRLDNSASGVSGVSIETKDGISNNRILMNPGANAKITIDDVRYLENEIQNYSILILQFEIPMEVNEYLAKLAHENGVIVIVNPAPSQPLANSFYKEIDYFTPNEHEAADLSGVIIHSNGKKCDDNDITNSAQYFLDKGVKNVLITLGSAGSVLVNGKTKHYVSAIPNVKPVDPTGAGDSYIGAFAAGLYRGLRPEEAMKLATYVGALTVQKMGAIPSLPTLREVEAYVEKNNDEAFVALLKSHFPTIKNDQESFDDFKAILSRETDSTIASLKYENYLPAVTLIEHSQKAGGRLHITGIGKPSHVAEYYASLLSSTGSPAYYLHGTEAVHGSCGQLVPGDVVIAISNSGETNELKSTITAVRKNGCKIIGVSGNPDSWLAHASDAFLLAKVQEEGGPLNKAPRASFDAELIVLQGLSVILQSRKHIGLEQYGCWHPGGKLGESIQSADKK